MKNKFKEAGLGYLLIALAGICWGTGGLFVTKLGDLGVPTHFISFTGHFLAMLMLFLLLFLNGSWQAFRISKRGLTFAIIMGLVGKAFFLITYNSTIQLVGVSLASVLLYLSPIFTSLLSIFIFKDRLTNKQILALMLNLLGSSLAVTQGNLSGLDLSGLGIALGLLSAILYAANTIIGKIGSSQDSPLTMTFYMLLTSSLFMFFVSKSWLHLDYFTNGEFAMYAFLNALLPSLLANICYISGLSRQVDPSRVSVVASIEIVVATLLGVLILKENMNGIGIIGILVLLVSIILMNQPKTQTNSIA